MVTVEQLKITQQTTQDSISFGYGEFKINNSQLINFGAIKSDGTLDKVKIQKIIDMFVSKALRIIKRNLDTHHLLTMFVFDDFNDEIKKAIIETVLQQVEGAITDGNMEIKNGSSFSSEGVQTQSDISGFLISNDRIYKATEDVWREYGMDEIYINQDDQGYFLIDNRPVFNFKFMSGQPLNKVSIKGTDLVLPSWDTMIKAIKDAALSSKEFHGTWDAKTKNVAAQINAIFLNTGLTLTDGTHLDINNISKGDSILIKASQENNFLPEGVHWDGNVWEPYTSWNVLMGLINDVKAIADDNKINKADKTSLDRNVIIGDGTSSEKLLDNSEDIVAKTHLDYMLNGINAILSKKLDADIPKLTQEGLPSESVVTSLIETWKLANINKDNIAENKLGVDDYWDEKGHFVRLEDLSQNIKILMSGLSWVEVGNSVELDLSGIDLTKMTDNNKIVIKSSSSGTQHSIYIFDSYNDASQTDQTVNVDGSNQSIQVKITNAKAIINGLNANKRTFWVANMIPSYIEQVGSSGTGSADATARAAAAAAQQTANDAKVTSASNTTKINTNKNNLGKVSANFPTIADIVNTNPLTGIAWTEGDMIQIRDYNSTGKEAIGLYDDNDNWKFFEQGGASGGTTSVIETKTKVFEITDKTSSHITPLPIVDGWKPVRIIYAKPNEKSVQSVNVVVRKASDLEWISNYSDSGATSHYWKVELDKTKNELKTSSTTAVYFTAAGFVDIEYERTIQVRGGAGGGFTEADYFTENSKLLTQNNNDLIHTNTEAHIGKHYAGTQNYAKEAQGTQNYSRYAHGRINIAENASGSLNIHFSELGVENIIEFKEEISTGKMWLWVEGKKIKLLRDI